MQLSTNRMQMRQQLIWPVGSRFRGLGLLMAPQKRLNQPFTAPDWKRMRAYRNGPVLLTLKEKYGISKN